MSFFKELNVLYWTNSIYNSTQENIDCAMDVSFNTPFVDNARNYVCAIERLEVSGNGIPYYDVDTDPLAVDIADTGSSNIYKTSRIYLRSGGTDLPSTVQTWTLTGRYYSLQDIITKLNQIGSYDTNNMDPCAFAGSTINDSVGVWSLDNSGAIQFQLRTSIPNSNFEDDLCFAFDSQILASIFGLPRKPENPFDYSVNYGQYDSSGRYQLFKTKYSRIDAGQIPSIIQLRSNLPFESDQINTAKSNIATDFALVANSNIGTNYNFVRKDDSGVKYFQNTISSYSWSFGTGGIIIYNPNEKRWLNFNAPTPIIQMRFWVEYVLNNSTTGTMVQLPPGCKFSIKVGFYLKDK